MVIHDEIGDVRAHLFNNTDTFVPQDAAVRHSGHITLHNMKIRPANGRSCDPDNGICGCFDNGLGHVLQCAHAWAVVDECFHGLSPANKGKILNFETTLML
jgi:hypothetical protein